MEKNLKEIMEGLANLTGKMEGLSGDMEAFKMFKGGIEHLSLPKYLQEKLKMAFKDEKGGEASLEIGHLIIASDSDLMRIVGITDAEVGVIGLKIEEIGLGAEFFSNYLEQ